ncbi:MAG: diphosphomevalonate decarboxylase [Anaerolinea sp. 4484_236]|nr:MAG: diphosphomevalonate decarboxylase [Anaerolinea sp. 4484_236]OQY36033.1 MAG: diphosphomevalonate decarboxylase [Anaerolineaceae bacterium 4572_5.2]
MKATAIAHPNIAFIKYWGNRDHDQRIPANGSFSMNLEGLSTRTQVDFNADFVRDSLTLNGTPIGGTGLQRVSQILDEVRAMAGNSLHAEVRSENNFPTGAGIASSAAAFAALALATSKAAGLDLDEPALSRLARHGSGSACRSVPGGFVEWTDGETDESSYAFSLAPADHWDLADCIAVASSGHKATGSTQGHALADTSPLQAGRVDDAPRRIEICRRAILERDFDAFAAICELDSDMMHAVMMTSNPALFYWKPATLRVMREVRAWRTEGLPVFYTIDAGPNVHVICMRENMAQVAERLAALSGVKKALTATVGGPARLVD